MTKVLWLFLMVASSPSLASFSNFNSVLIGERAAGMGGAYTALTGDPAANSFYNPATLSRLPGATLSAAVSLYNKYDTQFGGQNDFNEAPLRVNRGSILPLPASAGTVHTFGNFAFGTSIVLPDFDVYAGEVRTEVIGADQSSSYLNLRDESLWVGGSLAMNLSDQDSIGLTMYYTSRTFNRSITDQNTVGGVRTIFSEEKSLTHNSIIYILGYYRQLNQNWSIGLSHRLPSLPVSGSGTYIQAEVSSSGAAPPTLHESSLTSNTDVPTKTALGIAYERNKNFSLAVDVQFYGADKYRDINSPLGGEIIDHVEVWNVSLGMEYYLKTWQAMT